MVLTPGVSEDAEEETVSFGRAHSSLETVYSTDCYVELSGKNLFELQPKWLIIMSNVRSSILFLCNISVSLYITKFMSNIV